MQRNQQRSSSREGGKIRATLPNEASAPAKHDWMDMNALKNFFPQPFICLARRQPLPRTPRKKCITAGFPAPQPQFLSSAQITACPDRAAPPTFYSANFLLPFSSSKRQHFASHLRNSIYNICMRTKSYKFFSSNPFFHFFVFREPTFLPIYATTTQLLFSIFLSSFSAIQSAAKMKRRHPCEDLLDRHSPPPRPSQPQQQQQTPLSVEDRFFPRPRPPAPPLSNDFHNNGIGTGMGGFPASAFPAFAYSCFQSPEKVGLLFLWLKLILNLAFLLAHFSLFHHFLSLEGPSASRQPSPTAGSPTASRGHAPKAGFAVGLSAGDGRRHTRERRG
jgi:hypothetical protein